ncbi:G-PROTEIN-RECEP-F1-2 domain-containing protein [Aphelenchoides besseyi]|nr:G-PROTEIN-RECEP-F1-2 domain-containing protein [Aphelenchoides besseyi]
MAFFSTVMAWKFVLIISQSIGGVNGHPLQSVSRGNDRLLSAIDSNPTHLQTLPSISTSEFSAETPSSNHIPHHPHLHHLHRTNDASAATTPPTPIGFISHGNSFIQFTEQQIASALGARLCLGLDDIFVALLLILLILLTIFGNVLVVLSVCLYKRMRTFTNMLLTSLATADLLVGLVVMPLALVDLLYDHNWPFGRLLCSIWATTDVLLCTASILNLCVISLDRYMAITSPLKYPRTRSRLMATVLLSSVWFISLIVCSPPWFVPGWGIFAQQTDKNSKNDFVCVYSPSIPYRIYSASGSFYIPLMIMLSVYFKIFRVASEREKLMRQSLGTCRLSRRIDKTRRRQQLLQANNHNRCASAPTARAREMQVLAVESPSSRHNNSIYHNDRLEVRDYSCSPTRITTIKPDATIVDGISEADSPIHNLATNHVNDSSRKSLTAMERESRSLVNLTENGRKHTPPRRKNTELTDINSPENTSGDRLQPTHLVAKAQQHYHMHGPGKAIRGSKEKIVYMRERKALKTIGIVVLGFIICWMPFFVIYLIEVFMSHLSSTYSFRVLNEFFLWLGYSNSLINPVIYVMYNGDFRRCFRDLLGFGCIQHHRRTMSVKKLHQQSTVF